MNRSQYFELVKLQSLVYCQLYIFLPEDKELLNPVGFGSGFLADYKGRPFLVTADHVLHLDDYESTEVRTGNEYIIAIINNVNNLDGNISTVLTPLSGFYYAEQINIKDRKEDLIDISVCLLKEINFQHPFLTHEISIEGNIIQPAGIEKMFYNTSHFTEPTDKQKYSMYGVVRNDIVGIRGTRTNALYSNISYNGVAGNYFVFEYPDEIIEDNWVGISGAPIFDYEGNIVGVGHRVLGNGIWITPIKYAIMLMNLAIAEQNSYKQSIL